MQREKEKLLVNIMTGAYTRELFEFLPVFCDSESIEHIYRLLSKLCSNGDMTIAFKFIQTVYDMAGLKLPIDLNQVANDKELLQIYVGDTLDTLEFLL